MFDWTVTVSVLELLLSTQKFALVSSLETSPIELITFFGNLTWRHKITALWKEMKL